MSAAADTSPRLATMLTALDELHDIAIAAQFLSERYGDNGQPYLKFRARELEHECHQTLDEMELLSTGWEPTT